MRNGLKQRYTFNRSGASLLKYTLSFDPSAFGILLMDSNERIIDAHKKIRKLIEHSPHKSEKLRRLKLLPEETVVLKKEKQKLKGTATIETEFISRLMKNIFTHAPFTAQIAFAFAGDCEKETGCAEHT